MRQAWRELFCVRYEHCHTHIEMMRVYKTSYVNLTPWAYLNMSRGEFIFRLHAEQRENERLTLESKKLHRSKSFACRKINWFEI